MATAALSRVRSCPFHCWRRARDRRAANHQQVDGSIFVPEDADLLATFGQAAIAIENARLFDMTDQQLALRVQDTMQRIDQELNRTLNLKNVVDITMDWALRRAARTPGR